MTSHSSENRKRAEEAARTIADMGWWCEEHATEEDHICMDRRAGVIERACQAAADAARREALERAEAQCQQRGHLTAKQLQEMQQSAADAARREALEEAAKVAENFGPSRPIVHRQPGERIRGRWEGEQAASSSIALLIRTLAPPPVSKEDRP